MHSIILICLDWLREGNLTTQLIATEIERDLGVIFDENLNFETHIHIKIQKCYRMIGLLKFCFKHLDPVDFVNIFVSTVRPHIEYCSPVWNKSSKTFSAMIEKIQKKATKIPNSLKNFSYEERLRLLSLPSLEFRRFREDLIPTFKICKTQFFVRPYFPIQSLSHQGPYLVSF